MTLLRANAAELAVLLIDAQPEFLRTMHGDAQPVLSRLGQLLIISEWFNLPVLATFEEPIADEGELPEQLESVFPVSGEKFPKATFDLCREAEIREAVKNLGRRQLAVAGAETDVCVLQSVLGLIDLGYDVFLLEDCLFSSEPTTTPALSRMYQAGAIPCTYKTLFYELLETVNPQRWEAERESAIERGFVPPESLPSWGDDG